MSLPPTGLRTSGAITTSSGAQGPLGWASGVGVGFGGLDLRGFLVPLGIMTVGPLEVTDGVSVAAACTAPGSAPPESLASLDPTSTRPTANTISAAVPNTANRRTQ
jgi:hypothetical protein